MALDDTYLKNISPLQTTQIKPASVTSALDPALKPSVGGYTNPMLEQQKMYGPKLAEAAQSYPGALQAARTAQGTAYDNSEKLYSGYNAQLSEPGKNNMWGRFGAALLAPTSTGSWAEGFGNAATAAMDARSNYRDKESMRQEKLMRSQLALEQLRADKPNAELGSIEDQMKAYELFGKVGVMQSETDLGNGPTPNTDDALIADHNKNPNKYISPRGQAMVEAARSRLAKQGEQAFELEKITLQESLKGGKAQPLDRSEANRVSKRLGEITTSADDAGSLKGDIAALRAARRGTDYEGGWAADTMATVGGWVGNDGANAMQQVRSMGENLRLALTQKTKGAISDSEMKIFGAATPGLNMTDIAAEGKGDGKSFGVLDAMDAAAERTVQRSMFMQSWVRQNGHDYGADEAWATYIAQNPVMSQNSDGSIAINQNNISNWKDYVVRADENGEIQQNSDTTGTLGFDTRAVPPDVLREAQSQIDEGADQEQVINYLRETYGGN